MSNRACHNNHMTLKQASQRGMTLSQWCAHEQAETALDAIEQARRERVVFGLLIGIAFCAAALVLALGGPMV
jgi:ABC-type nickel/cobalt efflux system permease component RcnA